MLKLYYYMCTEFKVSIIIKFKRLFNTTFSIINISSTNKYFAFIPKKKQKAELYYNLFFPKYEERDIRGFENILFSFMRFYLCKINITFE